MLRGTESEFYSQMSWINRKQINVHSSYEKESKICLRLKSWIDALINYQGYVQKFWEYVLSPIIVQWYSFPVLRTVMVAEDVKCTERTLKVCSVNCTLTKNCNSIKVFEKTNRIRSQFHVIFMFVNLLEQFWPNHEWSIFNNIHHLSSSGPCYLITKLFEHQFR